ncbi:LINE-1 retrotransposable element ORF2 protein [Cucumis melo var. makuwa]|uniref:LINE-1 retrotransposable element ORF2 protein n=1 Tax=Cucumis melo var. makuwa TaxID=1194695 RepID=A0A5A7TWD5_CUCMM|nr:LINE-1 retrotransposable element ORF2 protein [Cucumis melo var. makuwa]
MTDIIRLHRISIKIDLDQYAFQEAQTWAQKCKRIWNLEGDENSAYFHKICYARQRRNFISTITSKTREACTTNDKIEKAFIDHFEEIYKNNREELWLIDNLQWSTITNKEREDLCKPFAESEIQAALKDFANNKSPWPDGFTIKFFKVAWPFLKSNILDIFKDFHRNGIINKVVNETYIALIAKKEKCSLPSDYRSISLTTALCKLIAKVIAERLKIRLPGTISENQMTFVKGRQITDAILIANEAVDY